MQILRVTTNPNANTFICDASCGTNGYTPVEIVPQGHPTSTSISQNRLEEIFREEVREYLRGLKFNSTASAVISEAEDSADVAPARSINPAILRNQPLKFYRVQSLPSSTLIVKIENESESWKNTDGQNEGVENVLTRFRDQRVVETNGFSFTKDGKSYFLDEIDFCCLIDFNDSSKQDQGVKATIAEQLNNGYNHKNIIGVGIKKFKRVPSTTEFIEALEHIRRNFILGKYGTCTQDLEFIESLPHTYLDYLQQTADKTTYSTALKQIDEWENAQIENPTWYL